MGATVVCSLVATTSETRGETDSSEEREMFSISSSLSFGEGSLLGIMLVSRVEPSLMRFSGQPLPISAYQD